MARKKRTDLTLRQKLDILDIATSLQDCRNSKFGKIEIYEPQDSPINSAYFGCRVVFLSAFLLRNSI